MPQLVPLAIAAALYAAEYISIGTLLLTLATTAGSFLLSTLLRPSTPSLPNLAQDRKQAVRSAIAPRAFAFGRTLISGPVLDIGSSGSESEIFHIVVVLTGHEIEAFEEVHINNTVITLAYSGLSGHNDVDRAAGGMGGSIRIYTYDGTQTTACSALVSEMPGHWTSDHVLFGCAYVYCRIQFDQNQYPRGFESIAAVVRGAKLYDPRDGGTRWSKNTALVARYYLTHPDGLGCSADEIDDAMVIAQANICDEDVALDVAETVFQKRYETNGVFRLDQAPIAIMEQLLSAGAGTLVYSAGQYRIHVAAYDAPAHTITADDLAGPVEVTPRQSRESQFNRVSGTFIDPEQNWVGVSFPNADDNARITADGEVVPNDISLMATTDISMAQRLARIHLLHNIYGVTVKLSLRHSALVIQCWDNVEVTLSDFGWSDKVFRVTSWDFDPGTGRVNVVLKEDSPAIYAWTALDLADPVTPATPTLVNALVLPAPTSLSLSASTAINADGQTVPSLLVTWVPSAHPFVTATEVQWRPSGATPWNSREVAAPVGQYAILPAISGTTYDVRVRGVGGVTKSAWTSTSTVTAADDTTPPGVPTSLSATAIPGGISLSWSRPTAKDLAAVEVYADTTGSFATQYYVAETLGAGYVHAGIGGGRTLYYRVRSRDRTGNLSAYSGGVSATSQTFATVDIASNAITRMHTSVGTSTLTAGFGSAVTLESISVDVPTGGSVKLELRLDLYQPGGLPELGPSGSGEGGGSE